MSLKYECEKMRKGLVYIYGHKDWWKSPVSRDNLKVNGEPYFIDMTPRLDDGHYISEWFDDDGIPRRMTDGELVYNLTRVCGYGLANYDRYLHTGCSEYLEKFMKIADWLAKNGEQGNQGFFVPYRYSTKGRPCGRNSAMSHGQVLSIFARAVIVRPQDLWQGLSLSALGHYTHNIEEGGVRSPFAEIGFDWFEEECYEKGHVLNGYLCAIEGLWDVGRQFQSIQAKQIYENALDALEAALPLFNSNFWSYYDCRPDKPRYLASYHYHVMHCVMLGSLARRHPDRQTINSYHSNWVRYLDSFVCRMRAMATMVKQKTYDKSR